MTIYIKLAEANIKIFCFHIYREALNLAESPTHSIKRERERDHDNASDYDHSDRDFMPPTKKDSHAILHALHLQSMQNQFYNNNSRRGDVSPINNNVSGDNDQHHHQRKNHLDQRLSSPIRNGSDKSPTVSTDLLSSGSPVALLSGMQFKLSSRGKFRSSVAITNCRKSFHFFFQL